MRVISLNMRKHGGSRAAWTRLAELIAAQEPDVALLQECTSDMTQLVCRAARLEGLHAHQVDPAGAFRHDGTAVAVRRPLRIEEAWRIDRECFRPEVIDPIFGDPEEEVDTIPERLLDRFSARTILARVTNNDGGFVAGSFHVTPGTSRFGKQKVHPWKRYFHIGVATALRELRLPFLFGIDANGPPQEKLEFVEPPNDRARRSATLVGRRPKHRARDLLVEKMEQGGVAPYSEHALARTYVSRSGVGLRYDQLWATREFSLYAFEIDYDGALEAGGDHALLAAVLRLAG